MAIDEVGALYRQAERKYIIKELKKATQRFGLIDNRVMHQMVIQYIESLPVKEAGK